MTKYSDYDSCYNCKDVKSSTGYYVYQCTPYETETDMFWWYFCVVLSLLAAATKRSNKDTLFKEISMVRLHKPKLIRTQQIQSKEVQGLSLYIILVYHPNLSTNHRQSVVINLQSVGISSCEHFSSCHINAYDVE
ncbi:Hypothetical_protein [Hexamita inflata]|uniref:Hypothetical_protein n=1 Tax=Hexamita inflata TaxID=28002 RepID=A0AA86UBF6_9EUKA|nr:Hypothetical protein HINF_LOCUS38805 [Hexamita inflata]